MTTTYQPVIGLEVHVQLQTKSKLFSPAASHFGHEANACADIIDLGLPGVLPVVNAEAIKQAVWFGLATGAHINNPSVFSRKHYFYPDLPKGYQISQYLHPICLGGLITIPLPTGEIEQIELERAHLEEDAGKSIHDLFPGQSAIDLNRAGTPLLEIVSKPHLYSPEQAVLYLKALYQLVCYLGICDGNLQEGSFRCDANISLRPHDSAVLGTRAEIKNLNSFRFVEKALHYEITRQMQILNTGGHVIQETRLYDATTNKTASMRSKEQAADYRYLDDPDLPPVKLDESWLLERKQELPELPVARWQRYMQQVGLSAYDADVLVQHRALADYFDQLLAEKVDGVAAAHWLAGPLISRCYELNVTVTECPISSKEMASLLNHIKQRIISHTAAKEVMNLMWDRQVTAEEAVDRLGLRQVNDQAELQGWVDQVLSQHPQQIKAYHEGKTKLMGFFVGQCMKLSQGKGNPALLQELIAQQLNEAIQASVERET